jgi:deoxyribodipyrimidine photolyase-related protein
MSSLIIILGNQLFDYKYYKNLSGDIFMAEDISLCTHFKYHKHKIMHFLISMREYKDLLKAKNRNVIYQELNPKIDYFKALKETIKRSNYDQITCYEIEDKFFENKIIHFCQSNKVTLKILTTPMFITSRTEFSDYLKSVKKPFMKTFYERQRKKFNILMVNNKPIGGQFSFDEDNRQKIPAKTPVHRRNLSLTQSPHLAPVVKLTEKYFSDHPGEVHNFWLPVNRLEAIKLTKYFIKEKLQNFGPYQDAIDNRCDFLNHSLISASVNIGHLTPLEVIAKVEEHLDEQLSNISSVEGFIRQVLGWREFVRGIYQNYDEFQQQSNFFYHKRKLASCWYDGTTGIAPVDDAIKKAIEFGYCHHIERLMVLSNIMLLLEVDPQEVYRWFMEMFVDSSDWVMGPNVFGMGQFSDGGVFATKPYIAGSNYLLKMSHYKKDSAWCDGLDGLYWRFIDQKRDFLAKNHRMSMMVKTLDKMDRERKKHIWTEAQKMQDKLTFLS